MTLYQFKALDEDEQLDIIFSRSIPVAERQISDGSFVLYQLNNFYIELYLSDDPMKVRIKTFNSIDLLDPYLININIDLD